MRRRLRYAGFLNSWKRLPAGLARSRASCLEIWMNSSRAPMCDGSEGCACSFSRISKPVSMVSRLRPHANDMNLQYLLGLGRCGSATEGIQGSRDCR